MSKTRSSAGKSDSAVVIQDIVIASVENLHSPPPSFATGEFGKPELFGGDPVPVGENTKALVDRLYKKIVSITTEAAVQHQKNCAGITTQLKPDKQNHITRVLVNEFFFYTKRPLTILQFEQLMQKVMTLAKSYPENLHLLLGSFAVLTPDNKVMNVVPQIECGPNPQISLIVKNHPSSIDPVYREKNPMGGEIVYPNIDINAGDIVSHLAIQIDGQSQHFSFNNVFLCKSAGGSTFHSCVDICLDHGLGAAKKRIDLHLETALEEAKNGTPAPLITTQCSHVVLSNWIYLHPRFCVGDVTQADPHESHTSCKQGAAISKEHSLKQKDFGTPAQVIITPPVVCNMLLAHELILVNYHNAIQQFISTYKGSPSDLKKAIAAHFTDFEKELAISELAENEIKKYEDHEKALQFAVIAGKYEIVEYFLKNKADVNLQTSEGHSLLLLATAYTNHKMIDLLLKHGADPRIANNAGETPLDYAHKSKQPTIVSQIENALKIKSRPPLVRKPREKKIDLPILPELLSSNPHEAGAMTSTMIPPLPPLPPLPSDAIDSLLETDTKRPPLPPLPSTTYISLSPSHLFKTTSSVAELRKTTDEMIVKMNKLKRHDVFDIQNVLQELYALKLDLETKPTTFDKNLYIDIFKSYLQNTPLQDRLSNNEKKIYKSVLEELINQMLPSRSTSNTPLRPTEPSKNNMMQATVDERHSVKRTQKGDRLFPPKPKSGKIIEENPALRSNKKNNKKQ